MAGIASDMNGGLQAFLEEQAEQPGTLAIDITTFDSTVETPVQDGAVTDIEWPVIVPRGSTALLDAIGVTVVSLGERLAKLPEERRPGKVVVMIVTDGQENSSREYTTAQVKKLVERQQNDYQWEFLFLGANIDSFAVAGGLGILRGSTIQYDATGDSANAVVAAASSYVTRSRSGLSTSFTDEERDSTQANIPTGTVTTYKL
jgi:hypothetical protein